MRLGRLMGGRRAVCALALGMAIFAACGGTEATPDDATQLTGQVASEATETFGVGDTATYVSFPAGPARQEPSWTIQLQEVRRSTKSPTLLLARVKFTALSDCIVSGVSMCGVSPRHFTVKAGGSTLTGTSLGISDEPKLSSVSLKEGETASGYVAFEASPDSGDLVMAYDPYPGQIAPQFSFILKGE